MAVQNRFAPLIAEGGPPPSRRLVLVGVQDDDVALDSDTETLLSHEAEVDVKRVKQRRKGLPSKSIPVREKLLSPW